MLSQEIFLQKIMADKKLYGECPECGESFPIAESQLFYGKPTKGAALDAVNKWKKELQDAIKELEKRKIDAKKRSKRGVIDVNVGKVLEKLAPALPGFSFDCHDCRPLFEPIDYIIFEGLTKNGKVDSIKIIDIKTGQSRLNKHQRQIRDAIEEKKVEWNTYRKEIEQ